MEYFKENGYSWYKYFNESYFNESFQENLIWKFDKIIMQSWNE